jgi:hypothetical protein
LGWREERAVALNGDHIRVVKFSSTEDSNYKNITENLALMIQDAAKERLGAIT